jgi:predicted nucleotidyltransferase
VTADTRAIAPEVARHLHALPEICRRHHVVWLDLFGSAVNGDFDPARSDVDVLAKFDWHDGVNAFRAYFGLMDELERLFGRSVDLATDGSIKNPYVLRQVDASRLRVFP